MNFTCKSISEKSQYSLLFIPMLAVYLPTIFYPVTDEIGSNVSFRPPGYVFAIVWPILLFLLGISWFIRRKKKYAINFIYILLIILLISLIQTYEKDCLTEVFHRKKRCYF